MTDTGMTQPDRARRMAAEWLRAQPVVTAFIRSAVYDFHDAEDILQQVAEVVVTRFDDFDLTQPFTPWAIGIARLKILEYRRSRARDIHVFDDQTLANLASAYASAEPTFTPMRQALEACVPKLAPRARRVLDMRYVRDMKPGTIASKMGLPANTVRVMLHRVRAALSKCIKAELARSPQR